MKPVGIDNNRIFRRVGVILALFLLTISIGVPLLLIFWQSVYPDGQWDWMAPIRTITGHHLSGVLLNPSGLAYAL